MKHKIIIRAEQTADFNAIATLIADAFEQHPHSNQKEQCIVAGLRAQQALSVSLVAEIAGEIVGHIAFSQVMIGGVNESWYGLAPVSVMPKWQHQGIGSKLIEQGLQLLIELHAQGCVLLGEPEYYQRFGFRPHPALILADVPTQYFMALPFTNSVPAGNVTYHQAFTDNS